MAGGDVQKMLLVTRSWELCEGKGYHRCLELYFSLEARPWGALQ